MRAALRVVDSLEPAGYPGFAFRFGGGTVLMLRFDHRFSHDVDLFFDDAQALGFLSPRLNDVAAAVAGNYQEQANSLKLMLPEGDIDFIVAGSVTNAAPETLDFEGRRIGMEAVAEILAKKLLYRAAVFKPRDLFDLGTVLALDRPAALQALAATRRTHDVLLRRLEGWSCKDADALWRDVHFTETGRALVTGMDAAVRGAIREVGQDG